jgi:hypothetical protein
MCSSIHLLAASGVIFHPELQVDTISTRLEPFFCMEHSNALRMAFLALRMAATDCTDWETDATERNASRLTLP